MCRLCERKRERDRINECVSKLCERERDNNLVGWCVCSLCDRKRGVDRVVVCRLCKRMRE